MPTLTRTEMEAVLAARGSVLHNGRIISRLADLPSEVDLAEGDSERTAAVSAALDAQIAALTAQRAQLATPAPAPKEPPPAPTIPKRS